MIGRTLSQRDSRLRHGLALASIVVVFGFHHASAQLRIATYNTNTGPRADSGTVLQSISDEVTNGFSRQVDVVLFQEHSSVATTTQDFVNLLNGIYGAGVYARSTVNGVTSGGGRPTMVYNTQTVQLVGELAFGTVSGSANARQSLRYQMRPVGYDFNSDFYLYNDHYKAGSSSSDQARRLAEAEDVRDNADLLGASAHIIYAGDFNIKNSFEAMYGELLTGLGNNPAIDPISMPGSWFNNFAFREVHTQSPVTSSRFPGQVTGGMDDRFDFQLVTDDFLDDEGLSYISGSYHALGNNGSHPLNGELDNAANTALTPGELTAIANASDHLPVVADYQLPAKMQALVQAAPAKVIIGAAVTVQADVENVAPVVHALGADELDYTGLTVGDASGVFAGSALALAGPDAHLITLDTAGPAGAKTADVFVISTSESVMNGNFLDTVSFDLLDHANESFNGVSNDDKRNGRFRSGFRECRLPLAGLESPQSRIDRWFHRGTRPRQYYRQRRFGHVDHRFDDVFRSGRRRLVGLQCDGGYVDSRQLRSDL